MKTHFVHCDGHTACGRKSKDLKYNFNCTCKMCKSTYSYRVLKMKFIFDRRKRDLNFMMNLGKEK